MLGHAVAILSTFGLCPSASAIPLPQWSNHGSADFYSHVLPPGNYLPPGRPPLPPKGHKPAYITIFTEAEMTFCRPFPSLGYQTQNAIHFFRGTPLNLTCWASDARIKPVMRLSRRATLEELDREEADSEEVDSEEESDDETMATRASPVLAISGEDTNTAAENEAEKGDIWVRTEGNGCYINENDLRNQNIDYDEFLSECQRLESHPLGGNNPMPQQATAATAAPATAATPAAAKDPEVPNQPLAPASTAVPSPAKQPAKPAAPPAAAAPPAPAAAAPPAPAAAAALVPIPPAELVVPVVPVALANADALIVPTVAAEAYEVPETIAPTPIAKLPEQFAGSIIPAMAAPKPAMAQLQSGAVATPMPIQISPSTPFAASEVSNPQYGAADQQAQVIKREEVPPKPEPIHPKGESASPTATAALLDPSTSPIATIPTPAASATVSVPIPIALTPLSLGPNMPFPTPSANGTFETPAGGPSLQAADPQGAPPERLLN